MTVPDVLPDDLADPGQIAVLVGDLRSQVLAAGGDLRGIPQAVLHKAMTMTGDLGVCVDAFLMDPRPRWLAQLLLRTPPA